MSPVLIAAIAALAIIAMVVGSNLVRDLFDERSALTREQRARDDRDRARLAAERKTAQELDIAASIFDPLGLFH